MKLLKTAVASLLVIGALALCMPSQASAFWPHYRQWHHGQYNGGHGWNGYHPQAGSSGYGNGYHPYSGSQGYGWNGYHPYADSQGYGWNGSHPYASGPAYGWNPQYSPYAGGGSYAYNNGYYPMTHQILPPNGEGMINHRNPNLFWACNSQGNHCHWQPRF
jgi:hypothetical protein